MIDLEENWIALCLSILKGYSVKESFEILDGKQKVDKHTVESLLQQGFGYKRTASQSECSVSTVRKIKKELINMLYEQMEFKLE